MSDYLYMIRSFALKLHFALHVALPFVFCEPLNASVLVTPERAIVDQMGVAISAFSQTNNGQVPINWNQIDQIFDLNRVNKNLMGRQSYPIEDHYQFITQPMSLPDIEGSQVLLIRTVPLENLSEPDIHNRKQWRYLIYRNAKGDVLTTRITEHDVQTMLKQSGVTITPKLGLPVVESEDRISDTKPKTKTESDLSHKSQANETTLLTAAKTQTSALVTTTQAPAVESRPNWLFISCGLAVALVIGAVVFHLWKK